MMKFDKAVHFVALKGRILFCFQDDLMLKEALSIQISEIV